MIEVITTESTSHDEPEKLADSTTEEDDSYDSSSTTDYGSSDGKEDGSCKGGELKRPDLKGSFRCSICSKIFCHSSSLSRHRMQAHFKSYKCTICRKDISNSESLRTHMFKQHHISRMYMCRCCNWAFPDKSLLHLHLQSTNESSRHSVINRSCHVINDPYQMIRNTFENTNNVIQSTHLPITLPIPNYSSLIVPPQTSSWLATLPKPIPTTTPIYLVKKEEDEEVNENESTIKIEETKTVESDSTSSRFSRISSQSPAGSNVSFKSDFKSDISAFHQLNADTTRALIVSPIDSSSSPSGSSSSRISPNATPSSCFDCQMNKTKLSMTENKCKYLESRANTLQNEAVDAKSQVSNLEHTIHRMKVESQLLRDHNEIFQRKLLECQSLAVRFLQSDNLSNAADVQTFLNQLVNSTILV